MNPPYGRVVKVIDDRRVRIVWRGVELNALRHGSGWLYYFDASPLTMFANGSTPKKAARACGREIIIDGGYRLVRWGPMYSAWHLYKEGRRDPYATFIRGWSTRPRREDILAAIAFWKLGQ